MKLINVKPNQRVDLGDYKHAVNEGPDSLARAFSKGVVLSQSGQRSWILTGFAMSNPLGSQLRVDRGNALLARRDGALVKYGYVLTTGADSQIIDLAAYAPANYGIFIRFRYQETDPASRIFWDHPAAEEYTQTIPTRLEATWDLRIEQLSPGADWLRIGTVAQATMTITDERPFFFEGSVDSGYASGWGGGNDRDSARSVHGVKDLQTFTEAVRQRFVEISGGAWYETNPCGESLQDKASLADLIVETTWVSGLAVTAVGGLGVSVASGVAIVDHKRFAYTSPTAITLPDGASGHIEVTPAGVIQATTAALTGLAIATWTTAGGAITVGPDSSGLLIRPQVASAALTSFAGRIATGTWTERANPKNFNLYGVTRSPDLGLFCAVGDRDGTDAYIVTSPGGITWTERAPTVSKNRALLGVTWSPDLGLFCAVGEADGTDAYIVTSPDGITWTERANPKNFNLHGVTWSPDLGLFCAVGQADGTDAYMVTSPDGITWTERAPTVSKNFALLGVTWSPALALFCAVGQPDGTDAYIVTSPDGITWTERAPTVPKNLILRDATWSPDLGLFCAVGEADGTDAYIITSPDGITWTERANPKNFTLYGVTWSPDLGLFCAVGSHDITIDAYMLTSPNGITWTERPNPKSFALASVAWSPALALFCAVGQPDGTDAYIVTSLAIPSS